MCNNKSLSEIFKSGLDGYYYSIYNPEFSQNGKLPDIYKFLDSEYNAYRFIEFYSKHGGKDLLANCFEDIIPNHKFNGKHRHTVALYYLGYHLKNILEPYLNKLYDVFLNSHISESGDNNKWNFCYTWFLTCLFHDTASCLEKHENNKKIKDNEKKLGNLNNYISNLQHKVFKHKFSNINEEKTFYYDEKTLKQYYKLNKNLRNEYEHGILGGYTLFDKFIQMYNKAYDKYKEKNISENDSDVDSFILNELIYSKKIIDHFAMVAQTIMCHNIWTVTKGIDYIQRYEEAGLNKLIIGDGYEGKKINLKDKPLLFFLDLLDSIEPIKAFMDHDPHAVLENIFMDYNAEDKILTIKSNPKMFCIKDYYKWVMKILNMQNWMDITVTKSEEFGLNKLEIQFNNVSD